MFVCLHGNVANVENLGVWEHESMHLSSLSKLAIRLYDQVFDYLSCLHFESWDQHVTVQDTEIYHRAPFFAGLWYN